jgi:ParB/RepB/Spo0J family partition protein
VERPQTQGELAILTGPLAELATILSRKNAERLEGDWADQVPPANEAASAGRRMLDRRRATMRRKEYEPTKGVDPEEGELLSQIAAWTRLIPLADVELDSKFKDVRIYENPLHPEWHATDGQHISDLAETMRAEGLKLPIVVLSSSKKGKEIFLLRAGRRRRKAALLLGWKQIPAIVLPEDMPTEMQHWYNILENCGRKNLTTYELAVAIKHMRDEFGIKPATFSRKTGFSAGYVSNLLGCLDRLPDELIEQWRSGARVAFDQWVSLSYLDHEDAIRTFQRMVGMSPKDRLRRSGRGRRRPLPPARWISRMQKLYIGIEGSDLPPRTRSLALRVIEVCMGQSDDVPGVYEPGRHRKYEAKARLRRELALPDLPDPGEDKETPPPADEVIG